MPHLRPILPLLLLASSPLACGSSTSSSPPDGAASDATQSSDTSTEDVMQGADASGSEDASADGSTTDASLGAPDASSPEASSSADSGVPDGASEAGAAIAHAYATESSGLKGGIAVYELPLTATSMPVLTLAAANMLTDPSALRMSHDGKTLWVMDQWGSKVAAFDVPVAANSMPSITIPIASISPEDGAFDSAGNLWLSGPEGVQKLAAPLTSATKASFTMAPPGGPAVGLTVDSSDNLYVSGLSTGAVYMYASPVTAASTPAIENAHAGDPSGLLISGSTLYVSDVSAGSLLSFPLPLTANAMPTVLSSALKDPERLAIDPSGRLVVADNSSGQGLDVLAGPAFKTLSFNVPNGMANADGVAFGP